MQFEVYAKGLATLSVDCIVLGVFEDGEMSEEAVALARIAVENIPFVCPACAGNTLSDERFSRID